MRGVKCEGVCKHFCPAQFQLASSGPVASCTEISFLIPEGDTGNRNANYLTQLDLISIVSQPIKVVVVVYVVVAVAVVLYFFVVVCVVVFHFLFLFVLLFLLVLLLLLTLILIVVAAFVVDIIVGARNLTLKLGQYRVIIIVVYIVYVVVVFLSQNTTFKVWSKLGQK